MPTASGHTKAIRATRVIGTPVYDTSGERLGEIEDIILDKTANSIMFAAIGFGGVLGMGEKYHPVPWASLDYDREKGGFIIAATKEQLKQAPCDTLRELTENDGQSAREAAFGHYGAERYW